MRNWRTRWTRRKSKSPPRCLRRSRGFSAISQNGTGEGAGFAVWFLNFSTFRGRHGIYLEDIFVRPALRGRGIGKALMARLAARCVEQGWARLEWAVLDWNAPSIAFYKSIGAQVLDEWKICRLSGEALATFADREAR